MASTTFGSRLQTALKVVNVGVVVVVVVFLPVSMPKQRGLELDGGQGRGKNHKLPQKCRFFEIRKSVVCYVHKGKFD